MRQGQLFLLIISLLSAPLQAQTVQDLTITTRDNVALDATITAPTDTMPAGGFPGVVLVHGYGGNKNDMAPVASVLATNGYVSLAYSVRGQGNSGGFSTTNGETERLDLAEVLQHLRTLGNVNSGKIGVAGASQGGIHAWMAAVYRMPGVAAVVPTYATPRFAKDLVPNNCVKQALVREMSLSTVRYAADRDLVRDYIIRDEYDSVLAYIESRDLQRLVDSVQVPVFQGLGWKDDLFPANAGIRAAGDLVARGVPVWSYYGTNGHLEPLNFNELLFVLTSSVQWLNHWLKGEALDQADVPLVFYLDDRPEWPHHVSQVWPPEPTGTLRLYVNSSGLAPVVPPTDDALDFSLQYDTTYTSTNGWTDQYSGARFQNAFKSSPVRLLSPPFADTAEVTGIPRMHLVTDSDAPQYQANVRIYDVVRVDSGLVWRLITRGTSGIRRRPPHTLNNGDFECSGLSHLIPPGHMIGAEVTSLDVDEAGNAHIIPYFLTAHSRLYSLSSNASYIDIPLVGSASLAGVNEHVASVPQGFVLHQNYPNPFNPNTVVSYQLSVVSNVKLAVYDIVGREVAVLVNERKVPGSYEVRFDATGLASGVYFYRITAGDFAQTRKMIVLK